MSEKRLFDGFDAETQKQYEREARLQYGPTIVNESVRRWNSYTQEEQQAIMEEGGRVYQALAEAMEKGLTGRDAEVIALLDRWQDHTRIFYEPTLEIMRGLGEMYNTSPDFMATFQKIHPDLPAYLQTVITVYVDDLETAEIERLLAADETEQMGR
jgi:MerR family transcriptional regulator, thiopeptide resistance regulator